MTVEIHSRRDASPADEKVLEGIRTALSGLRYGSVEITVHESRVVQIERKEKLRFESTGQPRRQL